MNLFDNLSELIAGVVSAQDEFLAATELLMVRVLWLADALLSSFGHPFFDSVFAHESRHLVR